MIPLPSSVCAATSGSERLILWTGVRASDLRFGSPLDERACKQAALVGPRGGGVASPPTLRELLHPRVPVCELVPRA